MCLSISLNLFLPLSQAILIIYIIIFVALIISNFLTDHDEVEENQEELKKYYSSGLRGKKSNRLRNLFISYDNSLRSAKDYGDKSGGQLNTAWTNKLARKSPRWKRKHSGQTNQLLDYDAQTECLL